MANPQPLIFQQLFEAKSSTFTYLLADHQSKEAILIDPVLETVDRDLKLISELQLNLKYVLDTHIHADHVTAAGEIRKRLDVKTAVAQTANVPCVDVYLKEGDTLTFGNFQLKVIETPGHTDASLSFYCEGMLFTGDALLIRGCGRTDFQSGSPVVLYQSVTQKLFRLPPETVVYPGHDYKGFTSSTIEAEMNNNPRLGKNKSLEEFVEIMNNLKLPYPQQMDKAVPANLKCGTPADEQESRAVPIISPETVHLQKGNPLIIDARPAEEFAGELGHIEGAHQITLGEPLKNFLEGYNRKERIIFVCRSGRRSEEATKTALALGYTDVFNMDGGMLRWNELQLPRAKG